MKPYFFFDFVNTDGTCKYFVDLACLCCHSTFNSSNEVTVNFAQEWQQDRALHHFKIHLYQACKIIHIGYRFHWDSLQVDKLLCLNVVSACEEPNTLFKYSWK